MLLINMENISFDLHKLGWKSFEDLIACIFRDIMGQTFQTFGAGADGGRDGSFHGLWRTSKGEEWSGTFTVQCKHTSKSENTLTASVIKDELPKVTRLAAQGFADNYILITNRLLPAEGAQEIEQLFIKAGAKNAKVYGSRWIGATIEANPKLRRLVPRLYGLGDLTQIVTHQAYRQAREMLDSVAHDLVCFVPTEAYRNCAHALQEHGFVLLLGEPASGKTMIANLMALSAADEWNLQTLMLAGPEDFNRLWNPDDPGQFLWVDDAFGSTQYESDRAKKWNSLLPKLKAAINAGARVVFTSRDYIFSAAKRDLKISAFELFDDSRVIIQVEKLTKSERQMILYNHLKTGRQPKSFKTKVKPHLVEAAAVPKFLPEIARRFANPKFTTRLVIESDSVCNFFEKPIKWLQEVIETLAPPEKAAIALVFISGGRLSIPLVVDADVKSAVVMMQSDIGEVKTALATLNDSLLRKIRENDREYWAFRHPTIRDAFAIVVGENPELVDIYLAGVSTARLLTEVSCGGASIKGVKIIIPPERFSIVADRLRAYKPNDEYFWFDPVISFLASRCNGLFLQQYFSIEEILDLLPSVPINIRLFDDQIKIINKIHANGFLSEEVRTKIVSRIVEICLMNYSVFFTYQNVVGDLLNQEEIDFAIENLSQKILTCGDMIVSDFCNEWDQDSDPEDMFDELKESLEFIVSDKRFDDDQNNEASLLLDSIEDHVQRMRNEIPYVEYEKLDTEEAVMANPLIGESIFDDVDE